MAINQINGVNTNISYKGKPVRRIVERGYHEGYFMEQSPLSKGYKKPMTIMQSFVNKLAKGYENIKKYFLH